MLTNVDCKRKTEKSPAVVRLTGTDIIKSFPRNLIDVHVKIQCSKSEIVFTRRTWPSADNILSKNLICCGLPLEIIKTEIPRGPVVTTPCKLFGIFGMREMFRKKCAFNVFSVHGVCTQSCR